MSVINFTLNNNTYEVTEKQYDPISGKYILKFNAPDTSSYPLSNHYYPVQLSMTDDNGDTLELDDTDETYGEYLRLNVRELTAPTITLISPESEDGKVVVDNHAVTLIFTVTDIGGSGLDPDSIKLTFGDSVYTIEDSELNVSVIENGYRIEFSPSVYLSDGDYYTYLEASDYDQNITVYQVIVVADEAGFSFIYNRTLDDVNRVKYLRDKIQTGTATVMEQLEYKTDLKGARNRSDFERILNAMQYICTYYDIPYSSDLLTLPEIPTISFINLLLTQLRTMRNTCTIHATTPIVPVIPINTYQKMNDIEKILYDMIVITKSRFEYYCDAGLIMDGEIGLIE